MTVNKKYILILVILAILVGGGILTYWEWVEKQKTGGTGEEIEDSLVRVLSLDELRHMPKNELDKFQIEFIEGTERKGGTPRQEIEFVFNKKTYLLTVDMSDMGMRGGIMRYCLYLIDKHGNRQPLRSSTGAAACWDGLDDFYSNPRLAIGYKGNLYIIFTGGGSMYAGEVSGHLEYVGFQGVRIRVIDQNNILREVAIGNPNLLNDTPDLVKILIQGDKLYFEVVNDYCYTVKQAVKRGRSGFYQGCTASYYLAGENGQLENKNEIFRDRYLKEAEKYDLILKTRESWTLPSLGIACLAPGTKILMADEGYKNIETIKQGDAVASFDVESSELTSSEVTKVIKRKDPYIILNDNLKAAPDEAVYLSYNKFKRAIYLEEGEHLLKRNGNRERINKIEYIKEALDSYDLELKDGDNFFANDYLVRAPLMRAYSTDSNYDTALSRYWLSVLLGRTLNYILAGKEEKAWQEFDKGFAALSKEHPLDTGGREKIGPQEIKTEIQKDLGIGN